MPQDAFTLRHIAEELDFACAGAKVNKIIQPSRDEVDLFLYTGKRTEKLLLNVNASMARAVLSDVPRSAPETAPNFCMLLRKHLAGAVLVSAAMEGFERILSFTFDCAGEFTRARRVLYAEIMGKYSNLILCEDGVILGALKISSVEENYRRILFPGVKYVPPAPQDKADPTDEAACAARLASYSGGDFPKFLADNLSGLALSTCRRIETALKGERNPEKTAALIRAYVLSGEKAPCVVRRDGEPADFCVRGAAGDPYPSVTAAADAFYREKEKKALFSERRRRLESLLSARKRKEEKKLAVLSAQERDCADMEKNRTYGDLITANIYRIRRGDRSLSAENYLEADCPAVTVPLDTALSPSANAQRYYRKYAKQKRTVAAVAAQKEAVLPELDYTESMLSALSSAESMLDLDGLYAEARALGLLPPEKTRAKKQTPIPFRRFEKAGFAILAGRNNLQNDLLLKEADPRDVWLHAQKYHSAHVIVRAEGRVVPDEVLLCAAEICAWYSDARAGGRIPVDFCERRFVKKPPKTHPGFVLYTDFRTLTAEADAHRELRADD